MDQALTRLSTAALLPAGGHFTHTGLVTGLMTVFDAVCLFQRYDHLSPHSPDLSLSGQLHVFMCHPEEAA